MTWRADPNALYTLFVEDPDVVVFSDPIQGKSGRQFDVVVTKLYAHQIKYFFKAKRSNFNGISSFYNCMIRFFSRNGLQACIGEIYSGGLRVLQSNLFVS